MANRNKSAEILDPIYRTIDRLWSHPKIPALLWIVWLISRIVHLIQINGTAITDTLIIDSLHYHQYALKFVEHGWGKDIWFMNPGYPTFVGILYWLVTPSPYLVMFVQTLLEGFALVLMLKVARKLLPEAAVRIAMLLWVGYYMTPVYNGTILTTSPILFLTVAAMYFLIDVDQQTIWWKTVLGGAMIGISILFRPIPMLFLLLYPVFGLFFQMNRFDLLKKSGLMIAGAIIVMLPFLIRNYSYSGHFGLTQTSGGMVFWVGNNENASGIYDEPLFLTSAEPDREEADYRIEASKRTGRELSQNEAANYWLKTGISWIVTHPINYLKLEWRKLLWFSNKTEIPTNLTYFVIKDYSVMVRMLPFGWAFILTFTGLGIFAIYKFWRKWLIIIILALTYIIGNLLFYTCSEYRFPLVPIGILLSATGIYYISRKLVEHNADKVMLGIMCLVPGFLLANYDNTFLSSLRSPMMDYFNWAQVNKRQGKLFEALENYHKALAIEPFFYEAHFQLAGLYNQMGFSDMARQEYTRIGLTGPDIDPTSFSESDGSDSIIVKTPKDSLNRMEREEKEQLYRKLLRSCSETDRPKVLLGLGQLLQEKNDLVEARRMLVEAEKIDTTQTEVLIRIAQIDFKNSKFDSALVRINRILDFEIDNVIANILKYQILVKLGRNTEAREQLTWLISKSNRDYHWGIILQQSLKQPLGFTPGPELKKIIPDTLKAPIGNW